jgi:hypothetical protein
VRDHLDALVRCARAFRGRVGRSVVDDEDAVDDLRDSRNGRADERFLVVSGDNDGDRLSLVHVGRDCTSRSC